jgi:hypothetical protein
VNNNVGPNGICRHLLVSQTGKVNSPFSSTSFSKVCLERSKGTMVFKHITAFLCCFTLLCIASARLLTEDPWTPVDWKTLPKAADGTLKLVHFHSY